MYKGSGAALLLAGTNDQGEFNFEGVCSNGDNELRLEKEMYRVSRVQPVQSTTNKRLAHVTFAMTRLCEYLHRFWACLFSNFCTQAVLECTVNANQCGEFVAVFC